MTKQTQAKKKQGTGGLEYELPHNVDMERSLVASILLDPRVIVEVIPVVKPEDFYHPQFRVLYQSMVEIFERGEKIDPVVVQDYLERTNRAKDVDPTLLLTLVDAVGTPYNAVLYAKQIRDYSIKRQVIMAALKIATQAGKPQTAEEYLATAEKMIVDIRTKTMSMRDVGIPIKEVVKEMQKNYQQGKPAPLLSTYVPALDQLIGGLYRQEVTIVAARPSIGKTLVGTWLAYQVAEFMRYPVLFVSAEMSAPAITYRIVQAHYYQQALPGRPLPLDKHSWQVASGHVAKLPIRIVDAGMITPQTIRAAALSFQVSHHGVVPLLIIDYLQLLHGPGKYRSTYERISDLSAEVKRLAKDLDTPVVLLAQLNRSAEGRPNKRPQVADLRDSGNIEQDADNIILLHRPGYYDPNSPPVQTMEMIVGKARNHRTGVVSVQVDLEWQSIIP